MKQTNVSIRQTMEKNPLQRIIPSKQFVPTRPVLHSKIATVPLQATRNEHSHSIDRDKEKAHQQIMDDIKQNVITKASESLQEVSIQCTNFLEPEVLKKLQEAKGLLSTKVADFSMNNLPVEPWVPIAHRTYCSAPMFDREIVKSFFKTLSYEGNGKLGDQRQDDRLNTIISYWSMKATEAKLINSNEYKIVVALDKDISKITKREEDKGKQIAINYDLKQIYINSIVRQEAKSDLLGAMAQLMTKDLQQVQYKDYVKSYLMDAERIINYYQKMKHANMNRLIEIDPKNTVIYTEIAKEPSARIVFPDSDSEWLDRVLPYTEEHVRAVESMLLKCNKSNILSVLNQNNAKELDLLYKNNMNETAQMIYQKSQNHKSNYALYPLISNQLCEFNDSVIKPAMRELASFDRFEIIKLSPPLKKEIQKLNKEQESMMEKQREKLSLIDKLKQHKNSDTKERTI